MKRLTHYLTIGMLLGGVPMAQAQSDDASSVAATDALLTQAEIETLVAPVALYPDTLLMQILVASTYPLEIVKADNLPTNNEGSDSATLESAIDAEGYDPSVGVLATAFPDVISDMAEHVEWTEAMGEIGNVKRRHRRFHTVFITASHPLNRRTNPAGGSSYKCALAREIKKTAGNIRHAIAL